MDIVHSPFSHIEKQGEFSKKNVDATHNVWRKINIFSPVFDAKYCGGRSIYQRQSHIIG